MSIGQGHFLTLSQDCVHMKIKTGISHKLLGRSYVSFQLQGNEKLFNDKVKFCNSSVYVGKLIKKLDFSETFAACDLKLIELMKIGKYLRSRSFLDLGPRSFTCET